MDDPPGSGDASGGMAGGTMRVDTDMVQTLARLLSDNDLTEIEVVDGDRRIAVRRAPPATMHAYPGPGPAASATAGPTAGPTTGPLAAPEGVAEPVGLHPGLVTSPMVGTVYLSPEPGARPLFAVGDQVAEGDTLLIIEAMKVMNQIAAPHGGTVTRILVQNAEPVEFGQPLLVIA